MSGKKLAGLKRLLYATSITVVALAAILLILANVYTGNTLRKGIAIEQTDVSWLSVEDAKNKVVEDLHRKHPEDSITLTYGEKQWILKLAEIDYRFLVDEEIKKAFSIGRTGGFFMKVYNSILLSIDGQQLEIGVNYDKDKLQSFLKKIKKECDSVEKNAEIAYISGTVSFKREILGKRMDIDRNTELIENQLSRRNFEKVALQVDDLKPHIVYDEIKDIKSVVSNFSTKFNARDKNRTDNIRLACSRMDNTILLPGDEFSMNEALGPRTLENGYKEAPVILKNELVAGTGGGVCQVSSTLYNAVLLAGLDVIERMNHSIPLTYIKPGRDATITEDSIDFRFKNSLDYPICLQTDISGGTLNINILGRKSENSNVIKLTTETIKVYPPGKEEVVIDDSLQYGETVIERKAVNGLRVVLYREIYKDGALLSREKLTEDYYKPITGKIRVSRYLYDIHQMTDY